MWKNVFPNFDSEAKKSSKTKNIFFEIKLKNTINLGPIAICSDTLRQFGNIFWKQKYKVEKNAKMHAKEKWQIFNKQIKTVWALNSS